MSLSAIDEVASLLIHELIDDIFQHEVEVDTKGTKPQPESLKDDADAPLPPIPTMAPLLSDLDATRSNSGLTPMSKRRRLGVNPGAHDQILRLRDTLQYVTKERDEWRNRCKDMQVRKGPFRLRDSTM